MPVFLGPFDPVKLTFNLMNVLLKRGLLSYEDARKILKEALDPSMPEESKEKILDSIIKKTNG